MIEQIAEMLTYCRPAYSKTDEAFIDKFIRPTGVVSDKVGNLVKIIGDSPTVMWSCHTDTVHSKSGYQAVDFKGQYIIRKDQLEKKACLGADDTAGVWLMLEMIRAKKEGMYIFHRAEEIGGQGSSHIEKNTPELLDGIKYAIALDRKGTRDVITHQGMMRCCSNEFASSLVDAIGMKYKPDDTGSFTDTDNYTDLVGECTNLSVGYEHAHTSKETLDAGFLMRLRQRLVALDYSKLTEKRKKGEEDPDYHNQWDNWYYKDSRFGWDTSNIIVDDGYGTAKGDDLDELVYDYPDIAVKMLKDYGVTTSDMRDEIYKQTGDLT